MRRPTTPVLVAATVLPMLLGGLALGSLGDRAERVDAVPAAVVNLDEPVRTGKGQDRQTVAAGRLLAAGLTSPARETDESLDWQLTTAEDARSGLEEGSYYAVVTIPEDFSRTVAGLKGGDPETAAISVRSNDASSALVGRLSDRLGEVAADRLGRRVTATYLEGLYARTGVISAQLGRAGDGAARVADGAHRLGEGTARLNEGAGSLAGGLGVLSGGAGRLESGAGRLSRGASDLADGTGRLADGSARLATGSGDLAAGLERLHARTRPLPGQARRLADGAGQVSHGVAGWSKVLLAWKQACTTDPVLVASHARLCAATVQAVGADGRNADALVSGSRQVAGGADRLADAAPALVDGIGRAAGGARRMSEGSERLAAGSRKVDSGARVLAAGASRLGAGAGELASGASTASDGAARLAGGTGRLEDGSRRLGAGSQRLADKLAEGADKVPDYSVQEQKRLAQVVSDPVRSTSSRINDAPSGETSLAPGVLALALWIGALATYLVRRALPPQILAGAASPVRVALSGWLPAVAVGVVQSLLLFAGTGLLEVTMESPFAVASLLVLAAAVFAAVNQALVAVLGSRRGWIVSIVLAVLQAVSLDGLVPAATAPESFQVLGSLLPVGLAAEGLGSPVLGGRVGSVASAVALLVLWGIVSLAATTLAARRRQRLTVADVRRSVATSPT